VRFSAEKGFGFITPDQPGSDLFVHHTAIIGSGYHSLIEGAKVSFDSETGPRGPRAVNVQPLFTMHIPPRRQHTGARRRARLLSCLTKQV
jgi:CspA family cold shock protein